MRPFTTNADAARKLSNSIVTYKGDPYVCVPQAGATGLMNLLPINPLRKELSGVDYTDNAFQVVPYELGFMNSTNSLQCAYVSRVANRMSDVGIITTRLSAAKPGQSADNGRGVPYNNIFTKAFLDMLHNIYPSFEEVRELVSKTKSEGHGLAFSKTYALVTRFDSEDDLQIYLYSGLVRIAKLDRNSGKFETASKNKRLMLNMMAKSGVFPSDLIAG